MIAIILLFILRRVTSRQLSQFHRLLEYTHYMKIEKRLKNVHRSHRWNRIKKRNKNDANIFQNWKCAEYNYHFYARWSRTRNPGPTSKGPEFCIGLTMHIRMWLWLSIELKAGMDCAREIFLFFDIIDILNTLHLISRNLLSRLRFF